MSDLRPDRPFDPVAAGLLARTVFSEHTASGQRIEVRELLVGPKQATVRHVLPAATLLAGKAMAIRVTTEMATKENTSVSKP